MGEEQQIGSNNVRGVATSGEQQARSNNRLKTMNGEQAQAKSNKQGTTSQIKATTQARASQKQKKKKHNLKLINYKPYNTKQKTINN
jgi:hypothetical protein